MTDPRDRIAQAIREASWATGVAMLDSDVAAFRDALLPVVAGIVADELDAAADDAARVRERGLTVAELRDRADRWRP
jgi:hypothetical protein